jgi:hypothetical protein
MKHILTTTLLAAVLGAAVHAQAGLTGRWQGETPNGAKLLLNLTATETTVTGTLTRNEATVPITEGKVTKNIFTFRATLNEQVEAFAGEWTADELTIWLDRQGRDRAVILKRVKE